MLLHSYQLSIFFLFRISHLFLTKNIHVLESGLSPVPGDDIKMNINVQMCLSCRIKDFFNQFFLNNKQVISNLKKSNLTDKMIK